MCNSTFVKRYLKRLQLEDTLPNDSLEKLSLLMWYHLINVPFETFDIFLKKHILLDESSLEDKIINRNRGGFCYELNASFAHLLRVLGYDIQDYGSRVHLNRLPNMHPFKDHRINVVTIAGKQYLAEVGFGHFFAPTAPLLIEENTIQENDGKRYRFIKDDFFGWILQVAYKKDFQNFLSYDPNTYELDSDYEMASCYAQYTPTSIFSHTPIAMIRTADGGTYSLVDKTFKHIHNGAVETTTLTTNEEISQYLAKYFAIVL